MLSAVRVRISADLDRRSLLSVGADFWWSPRGALFSVAHEARRQLVRLAVMVMVARLRVPLLAQRLVRQ